MFSVRIDENGAYQVRWPSVYREREVLDLGMAYVAREQSLPEAQRVLSPALSLIEGFLAAAQSERLTAQHSETARATAAETHRQTFAAAKPKLNLALFHLKARYAANLAQLEAWGLDTVVQGRTISVRKPRTEREWAQFLAQYVAKESSLAAAQQLPEPPLTEMVALNTALQTANAIRKSSQSQRETAVEIRTATVNRLLDLLQGAALVIVLTQFEGRVTNDLQHWGYQVVARLTKNSSISDDA